MLPVMLALVGPDLLGEVKCMCAGGRLSAAALVQQEDLEGLLSMAADFHGHTCPYLALGVRTSALAMRALGVGRAGVQESVAESLLAVVECNNCFTDGVQVATGCTLGNNSLVYLDLGKTALSLVRRSTWEGVRICVDDEELQGESFPPEASELFDKVVRRRCGTPEDAARLEELWQEAGLRVLALPDSFFDVRPIRVEPIEQAPIFSSKRCAACRELAMETRVASCADGKAYCLRCAGEPFHALIGRGIVQWQKHPQSKE